MGGTTVEEIQIIVDAEVNKAISNLKKVDTASGKTTKAILGMAKNIAGPAGLLLATKAFIDFSKESGKAASAAEESLSKFNVVFGESSEEMKKWAETASDSVNLSESRFIEMAASTGDLLKPLGFVKEDVDNLSKSFVELAFDVSSFNDKDPSEVLRDINAAITGSPETMKKYGVVINETALKAEALASGMIEVTRTLTAQEKAQATHQLILKGTTDAQGDLLRTMDSTANITRQYEDSITDIKIAFGDTVNRGMTPFKAALAGVNKDIAEFLELKNKVWEAEHGGSGVSDLDSLKADLEAINAEMLGIRSSSLKTIIDFQASGKAAAILGGIIAGTKIKRLEELEVLAEQKKDLIEMAQLQEDIANSKTAKEKEEAEAKLAKLKAEEANNLANEDAAARLAQLEHEKLSDNEKALKLNQDEINALVKQEELVGGTISGEKLLNELVEKRSGLRKAIAQEEAEANQKAIDANLKKQAAEDAMFDAAVQNAKDRAEAEKQAIEDVKKAEEEAHKQRLSNMAQFAGAANSMFSALSSLAGAYGQNRQDALDQEYAHELAALETLSADEQELKDTQRAEEIAKLKASGTDADKLKLAAMLAEEKRLKDLAKVQEELEGKKKQAAYETATLQWQLSLASGVASGAQSVLTTLASVPTPFNIPLAALAAATAGVQIAAITAAQPQKAFAGGTSGYITNGPESILVGDNPGGQERVIVEPLSSASSTSSGMGSMGGDLYIDGEKMGRWISNGTRDGDIEISASSVVA